MLDYRFIKDNLAAVKKNITDRNMNADADLVVELFDKRTALVTKLQSLQQKRNDNTKAMKGKLPDEERRRLIEEGKAIKEEIAACEKETAEVEAALEAEGRRIPNMAHPDAPVGAVDSDNLEVKRVGTPREFSFQPKDHVQLGQDLDLIDFEPRHNGAFLREIERKQARCERADAENRDEDAICPNVGHRVVAVDDAADRRQQKLNDAWTEVAQKLRKAQYPRTLRRV